MVKVKLQLLPFNKKFSKNWQKVKCNMWMEISKLILRIWKKNIFIEKEKLPMIRICNASYLSLIKTCLKWCVFTWIAASSTGFVDQVMDKIDIGPCLVGNVLVILKSEIVWSCELEWYLCFLKLHFAVNWENVLLPLDNYSLFNPRRADVEL